jgi:branched-chain amino acid aminotransferase
MDDHILASITRAKLIELMGAEERACTLDDLRAADEAFLASTTREVMPVAAVEDKEFGAAGPVTEDARRRLRERIEAELAAAPT